MISLKDLLRFTKIHFPLGADAHRSFRPASLLEEGGSSPICATGDDLAARVDDNDNGLEDDDFGDAVLEDDDDDYDPGLCYSSTNF